MDKSTKVVLVVALSVIIASAGFIGGFVTSQMSPTMQGIVGLAAQSPSGDAGVAVDQANEILQKDALEPPNETSATAGAIQGLLESGGDKYALYFDPQHYKYFNEAQAGEFGGIGVSLGQNRDGTGYVVQVYKGTPAERAGIKAGDVFVSIDGVTREKWTTEEITKRVRGQEGTQVKIVMSRPAPEGKSAPTVHTYDITRAMITYPNIETAKMGNVGYIRLGSFNAKATDDVRSAVNDLTKQGAKSFVLDLRDNPGGLLDQAITVTSLFVSDGVIVRVDERNKPEQVLRAKGAKITDLPLVVLVNDQSASASEIFAGAVQDYDRAKLVGVKTFGKGSVQSIRDLPGGAAIKFTTAHYLTPLKRAINGVGLIPDIIVPLDPQKEAIDLKSASELKADLQLQEALTVAREQAAARK